MSDKESKNFDYKDIQIARNIDQQDYKTSTLKISEKLGIPARSIRYRIAKLKEKGILQKKIAITHERKLGLVERIFLIEENVETNSEFLSIIADNQAMGWYVPTTGKYNGFIVHSLCSHNKENLPIRLMQEIKKKGIIKDFFVFETIDYKILEWNYDFFDKNGEWTWDWKILEEQINQRKIYEKSPKIQFENKPEIIDFDTKDIQILENLYSEEAMTLKDFGEILQLSESQVGRRIKSMEEKGIIKGYRTGFKPFIKLLTISYFATGNLDQLLQYVSKIPYPLVIIYQDENNIEIGIDIRQNELKDFLNFVTSLKNLVDSYFLQFWHANPTFNHQTLYDYYDKDTSSWIKLTAEYEKSLQNIKSINI